MVQLITRWHRDSANIDWTQKMLMLGKASVTRICHSLVLILCSVNTSVYQYILQITNGYVHGHSTAKTTIYYKVLSSWYKTLCTVSIGPHKIGTESYLYMWVATRQCRAQDLDHKNIIDTFVLIGRPTIYLCKLVDMMWLESSWYLY